MEHPCSSGSLILMEPPVAVERLSLGPQNVGQNWTLTPYEYHRLAMNFIRLFSFDESAGSGGISGRLETFDVNNAPPYLTLSYCWGTQKQDVALSIDGQILYITQSLADALDQLRQRTYKALIQSLDVKWIWIDQLCINQEDIPERSQQVKLMGSIYSGAIRTLIWLGQDDGCGPAAWQLIRRIYQVFKLQNPEARYLAEIPFRLYSDSLHSATGLPSWDDPQWESLHRLLSLPWFTRTWIIQEVALSTNDPVLIHGSRAYAWEELGWASAWLRRNGYLRLSHISNQLQNVNTIFNIRQSNFPWRLDALLVATSLKFQATDQRDKVYGLLGLSMEAQRGELPDALLPDYSLDVAQVYKRVGLYLIQNFKTLAVLTRSSGTAFRLRDRPVKQKIENLPTWTPDWSDRFSLTEEVVKSLAWIYYSNNGDPATLGFPRQYNAAAGLGWKLGRIETDDELKLTGFRLDIIDDAIPFEEKETRHGSERMHPAILRFWEAAVPTFDQANPRKEIQKFITTTTVDQHSMSGVGMEQLVKDGSAYLLQLINEHGRGTPSMPNFLSLLSELGGGGNPQVYYTLCRNFCFERSFFVTSGRRLGLGPMDLRKGDIVSILPAGGVPYLLRDGNRHSTLVGEAYVHGLMNGETIDMWRSGQLSEDTITLS